MMTSNIDSLFTVLSNFWGYLHQQDAGRSLLSMLASPFSFMLIPKQIIQAYFTEPNYLYSAFLLCGVSILTCYLVSVFTGNWSQVRSSLLFLSLILTRLIEYGQFSQLFMLGIFLLEVEHSVQIYQLRSFLLFQTPQIMDIFELML
jgi:hypothetical protein